MKKIRTGPALALVLAMSFASSAFASEFEGPYAICWSESIHGREVSTTMLEVAMKKVGDRYFAVKTKTDRSQSFWKSVRSMFKGTSFTPVFEATPYAVPAGIAYENEDYGFDAFFFKDAYSGVDSAEMGSISLLCEVTSEKGFAESIDPHSEDPFEAAKQELLDFSP